MAIDERKDYNKNNDNMIKKVVIIFLLATALLQAQSPNSGSDPQLAELESRESAEMTVPFDVIVSAMNPFYITGFGDK